jgi:hypothetical protein
MRKRSSFYLRQTDMKASKGFDKFLSGHLVKATNLETKNELYGIVVAFKTIQEQAKKAELEHVGDLNSMWAMWSDKSAKHAIQLYENIDDNEFVPSTSNGSLSCLSPREYEFSIIDL